MIAAGFAMILAGAFTPVFATTPEEAKDIGDKAAALVAAEGDKAFAKLSDRNGDFARPDLVVLVTDLKAVVLAHYNPKLVGMDTWEIADPDGVKFGQNAVQIASSTGSGWTSFKFVNPANKKIEPKKAWVQRVGDYVVIASVPAP
jgi:cytochrome c